MLSWGFLCLFLGSITLSDARGLLKPKGDPVIELRAAAASVTCLSANALQTGSNSNGQATTLVSGQTPSATNGANFINFCAGEVLTNGLQIATGSCNGVVMGKIPSTSNMVSSILISPTPGQKMKANETFEIRVQTSGLSAGGFTNEDSTYYAAPQDLSSDGLIIGHAHFAIQDLGKTLTPTAPPDPTDFVFFAAVPGTADGKGLFATNVTGGLPAGNYRVCSMASAANHQPVVMPVAQRGSQDDCQKFTVGK
ncbi:hypothetical protein BP5796_12887 [Coleophoma crateriformis]|uniref:Ribosomal protein s17 n=1 Tax=Coleophoma crateriformis TaxID=565419 RepID=A0A3D8Q573_9HELO|nr:hypothetical protein BP5796_12887 [Coleophoma crateriformis]